MAKIHFLEVTLNPGKSPRTGNVRCLYHVNISAQKNTNIDVSNGIAIGVDEPHKLIEGGGMIWLGVSSEPAQLGEHPDFGTTSEAALLSQQDIAEVEVRLKMNETQSLATIKANADSLYAVIQTAVQNHYAQRYKCYGSTSNPV